MNDIKAIVAKNITELRRIKGMTQLELAEQLNYSDKAVSKWERAESLPDVSTLVDIADLFEVSVDYLLREKHPKIESPMQNAAASDTENDAPIRREYITAISVLLVWLVAVLTFVLFTIIMADTKIYRWLPFVYAVPVSLIVWLVFNSIWFKPRKNYYIISLLMWSVIMSVHVSLLIFGIQVSSLYLLGIPGQLIIVLWSLIRKPKRKKTTE